MTHALLPGASPYTLDGGETGVLLLHGFTATPQSVRPWADALHAAGNTVHCPLLPGHGTSWEDLAGCTANDWLAGATAGLELLLTECRQVAVGALSFGALLALRLAVTRPAAVSALLLVNPYLRETDWRMRVAGPASYVWPTVAAVGGDLADPDAHELAYDRVPLRPLPAVTRLQRQVRRTLPGVTQPLFLALSRHDHVVRPTIALPLLQRTSAPWMEVLRMERSFHVATLDIEHERLSQASLAFLGRALGGDTLPH